MPRANTQWSDPVAPGYAIATVQTALRGLEEQLPSLRALRLDAQQSHYPVSRLNLTWAGPSPQQPGRTTRLQQTMGQQGWLHSEPLRQAMSPHVQSAEAMRAIGTHINALRGCNPVGAWVVSERREHDALVVYADGRHDASEGFTSAGGAYQRELAEELAEFLPQIREIVAHRIHEKDSRGQPRHHTFLRVIDVFGRERTAIDASLLAVHLQHAMLTEQGTHAGINRVRQSHWAEQLEIATDDLPLVLHSLHLMFQLLPVTELVLHT